MAWAFAALGSFPTAGLAQPGKAAPKAAATVPVADPPAAPVKVVAVESGPVLTLKQAYDIAVSRNPSMAVARAGVDSAKERVGVAQVPYLPSATVEASHSESTSNYAPRAGALPSSSGLSTAKSASSFDLSPYWSASANTRWTAWDFGRTGASVDLARRGLDVARADLDSTRNLLWLQVSVAYLQALTADALLVSLAESERQAERNRDMAKARVEAQIRPKLDLLKAESDLAAAQVATLRAEEASRSARVALAVAMGQDRLPAGPLQVPTFPSAQLESPDLGSTAWLDESVKLAAKARPEWAALEARVAAVQTELDALDKTILPSLYVAAQASVAGIELDALAWNYGMTGGVSVPLSTLWTRSASMGDARARLAGVIAQRDSLLLALRGEIDTARTALLQARKRTRAVESSLEFSAAARDHAAGRYAAGAASLFELADAETALTQARIQKSQHTLDLSLAEARLLFALGQIAP
jgi:outer membrane protein TolC